MEQNVFNEILKLSLQIEHYESQRRGTFNMDEKDKCTTNIKERWAGIDGLLDIHNHQKKLLAHLTND